MSTHPARQSPAIPQPNQFIENQGDTAEAPRTLAGRCLKGMYDNKGKIALGILAIGSIVLGILAKLDKLGKLPESFSQDAALGTSFVPLGILFILKQISVTKHIMKPWITEWLQKTNTTIMDIPD